MDDRCNYIGTVSGEKYMENAVFRDVFFAAFLRRMTVGYARNEKRQKTAILLVKY